MIEIKHKQTGEVLLRTEKDNLEGVNLTGANLAGADLTGQDISHACLRNVDLHGAMMNGAQLVGTCLDEANLADASLDGADLTDATLRKADLHHAHMEKCNLRYTKLTGANLSDAFLEGADLSMADARADLHHADLHHADLRGANLTGANLERADLGDANLTGAMMNRALIKGARTQGAKLAGIINDEQLASAETQARAQMMRRNSTAFQASNTSNPNALTGNGVQRSTMVACCYCQEPHAVPAARLGHHTRCSKCKTKFFVDQFGNASEPRATQSNQWTPEVKPVAAASSEMTLEIPDWLIPAGIGALLVAIGIALWMWL